MRGGLSLILKIVVTQVTYQLPARYLSTHIPMYRLMRYTLGVGGYLRYHLPLYRHIRYILGACGAFKHSFPFLLAYRLHNRPFRGLQGTYKVLEGYLSTHLPLYGHTRSYQVLKGKLRTYINLHGLAGYILGACGVFKHSFLSLEAHIVHISPSQGIKTLDSPFTRLGGTYQVPTGD